MSRAKVNRTDTLNYFFIDLLQASKDRTVISQNIHVSQRTLYMYIQKIKH